MNKLSTLKSLLGNVVESDCILEFYLNRADAIICDLRNSTTVEPQFEYAQILLAVELYNKRGAEGQTGHSENGISRNYEASDISPSLLNTINPFVKTPFSVRRVID